MLSQAQIDRFEAQGYLVVEDLLDETVLGPVKAEYADLMNRLYTGWHAEGRVTRPPESLDFWGQLMAAHDAGCDWFPAIDISLPGDRIKAESPFHFGPAVFDLLTAPRLLDVVEDLIGPEITSNPIQHVRIKIPGGDKTADPSRPHIMSTDWHQDRGVAHAEADTTRMITAWVAVTDATVENGCLQVIPMAQDQEMLAHCPMRQTSIPDALLDFGRAVPLPVGAGGVVLFHPLVPHASLPNVSDGFRWSFDLRYNVTGEPTGRAHFPDFVARSRAHPETELRDWRAWKTMWEDARTRLAVAPHIENHRWTGEAPVCA